MTVAVELKEEAVKVTAAEVKVVESRAAEETAAAVTVVDDSEAMAVMAVGMEMAVECAAGAEAAENSAVISAATAGRAARRRAAQHQRMPPDRMQPTAR